MWVYVGVWGCVGVENFPQYSGQQRGQEMDGWAVATQEYPHYRPSPPFSVFPNPFHPVLSISLLFLANDHQASLELPWGSSEIPGKKVAPGPSFESRLFLLQKRKDDGDDVIAGTLQLQPVGDMF